MFKPQRKFWRIFFNTITEVNQKNGQNRLSNKRLTNMIFLLFF